MQQVIKLIQNFQNVKGSETEMGSKFPSSLHTGCKLDTKLWMYGRVNWGPKKAAIKLSLTLTGPSVTEVSEHTESHSCFINFVTYRYVKIVIFLFYFFLSSDSLRHHLDGPNFETSKILCVCNMWRTKCVAHTCVGTVMVHCLKMFHLSSSNKIINYPLITSI
jgi:hypothetical protein